jgi:hypothetical protein
VTNTDGLTVTDAATQESIALKAWWTDERRERLHAIAAEVGYAQAMKVLWADPDGKEEVKVLFGVASAVEVTDDETETDEEVSA